MKLWSHEVAQKGSAMSPDEQEALSLRYGPQGLVVVALSSGRFAIFGRDCQLREFCEEGDLAEYLRSISSSEVEAYKTRRASEVFNFEPDDKTLARDLTVARSDGEKPKRQRLESTGIELEDFDL